MIDAMTTVTDPMFVFDRKRIVDFGIENKILPHEARAFQHLGPQQEAATRHVITLADAIVARIELEDSGTPH